MAIATIALGIRRRIVDSFTPGPDCCWSERDVAARILLDRLDCENVDSFCGRNTVNVINYLQPLPEDLIGSVFLTGPTSRQSDEDFWRPDAMAALGEAGYRHTVVVPRYASGKPLDENVNTVRWEQEMLHASDAILLWLPRDLGESPGFTTSVEFGQFLSSGKLYYGRPDSEPKTHYLDQRYREETGREPVSDLSALAAQVTEHVGDGARRTGGERSVPIHIWRTPYFQSWLTSQKAAGNRLDDARVQWQFIIPKGNFVLAFAVQVNVWVESEGRHKSNEFILGRPDIFCVVPWWRDPDEFWNSRVVLVREFRSPGRTSDGFIHELPGGSSFKGTESALQQAAEELREETGVQVAPHRFEPVQPRQYAGTFSTHCGYAFRVQLTDGELQDCHDKALNKASFGNRDETESTTIEVCTIREILSGTPSVDWSNIGIILASIIDPESGRQDITEGAELPK